MGSDELYIVLDHEKWNYTFNMHVHTYSWISYSLWTFEVLTQGRFSLHSFVIVSSSEISVGLVVLVYTKLRNILRAVWCSMRHFLADVTGDALGASYYHLQKFLVFLSPIHLDILLESIGHFWEKILWYS